MLYPRFESVCPSTPLSALRKRVSIYSGYNYVVSLRAVETIDFMTARWVDLPYDFLDHVSRRTMNEFADIARVVYDIFGKPPGTIEWG